MDKVKLVQPDFADDEVAAIFDDIRKTTGANFLTPTWGFFALDIELLKGWWTLTKRLQMTGIAAKAIVERDFKSIARAVSIITKRTLSSISI